MTQQTDWRRFVERRRRELRDDYPCAMPIRRTVCPRHGIRVPQQAHVRKYVWDLDDWVRVSVPLTGICKRCRDELYDRLAAEYVHHREEMIMTNKSASPAEDDRPQVGVVPVSKPVHVLGQLELFDADGRPCEHDDETEAEEAIDDAA